MKFMMQLLLTCFMLFIFTACSKQVDEPYFDRAKQASEDAHSQLKKD